MSEENKAAIAMKIKHFVVLKSDENKNILTSCLKDMKDLLPA